VNTQALSEEYLFEPGDIVHKHGCARMFGVDGANAINSVNYLMRKGIVPPYEGYIGRQGYWTRQTLREARDTAISNATKKPANVPPPSPRSVNQAEG
jgi:hypothetical protein